jgi:hypothetical protein
MTEVAERLAALGEATPYAAVAGLLDAYLRAESARTGVLITAHEAAEPVEGPEEIALCEEPT